MGSTAPVDAETWALADRLATPVYTADTTAALIGGLARSGIGTYADPSSQAPDVPLAARASPTRLLDFQAHALAVGAWAGSTFSGTELDAVVPLPPGATGMPTTSELLAAYVATPDSPGGALSRALMAGQDLLVPTTTRFPGVVLVLFASDLATDGGRLAAPGSRGTPSTSPSPSPSAAARGSMALVAMAAAPGVAADVTEAAATGGICTTASTWVESTISSLFNALKLATPSSLPGAIIVSMWNWLVDAAHSFVNSLISAASDAVLGTIRSIAGSIASVAQQVASFLPYAVRVSASGDTGGATFNLGPAPLAGTFTATVTAGDLPAWPAVLADCASVAGVPLPDFRAKGIPLTWGPLEPAAGPLLAATGAATTNAITDANGQSSWDFLTSTDPGDPAGEQRNQVDDMRVTVFRPEIAEARTRLTSALMGWIPTLLRPYVSALFAPYVDGLQARLNAILEARGDGVAILIYHAPVPPTPSPAVSPAPSGACSPSPLPPGSYTGTNTSSETIRNRPSVTRVQTSGPMSLQVAADGTVTGTWGYTSHFVYDADVSGVQHHHESTTVMTGGTISGSACDVVLHSGTTRVTKCVDSLAGDCVRTSASGQKPAGDQRLGPPTSTTAGTITWRGRYDDAANGLTTSFRVSVRSH